MAELTGRVIMKEGVVLNKLFEELVKARYDGHSEEALSTLHGLWRSLPLAARTPNRVFISHSTPSAEQLAGFTPKSCAGRSWTRTSPAPAPPTPFAGGAISRRKRPSASLRLSTRISSSSGTLPAPKDTRRPIEGTLSSILRDSGEYLLAPLAGSLTYDELVGRIRPIWRDR